MDGWLDGRHRPARANGDAHARHALIDSEKMDLDVRKLWDGSKNLQESDNPLLASPAPEIMDVHPLRFCSNRKCAVPTGAGRRRLAGLTPFFLFRFIERQIIEWMYFLFLKEHFAGVSGKAKFNIVQVSCSKKWRAEYRVLFFLSFSGKILPQTLQSSVVCISHSQLT